MSNKETSIKDALYQPLTEDSRKGRGGTYSYVKWQAVADRMNETFGMNWSSNVEYQEIIGDQIIIRVSVCARDPLSDREFCQEGYGGSQMRPSDEPGSAHKGAYSKALKDACKKWGIGLHLEEGGDSNFSSIPEGFSGHETAPAPSAPPTAMPSPVSTGNTAPAYAMPTLQVVEPPPIVAKQATPVAPMMPSPTPVAPMMPSPTPVGNVTPMAPPTSVPTPASASAPAPAPAPAPPAAPVSGAMDPNAPGTINNVQEMAIKNLARLSGIEDPAQLLTDLVNKEDTGLTRKVTNLNDLSYTEAVNVIKAAKNLQ